MSRSMLVALLACAIATGAASVGTPDPGHFRLLFIAGPKVAEHPGLVDRGLDWACSAEPVIADVESIPADDTMLIPDDIVELGADGKRIATWRVPLEADPVGISGDVLTVIDTWGEDDPRLAVGRDGSLARAAALPRPPESAYSKCPANDLPESGYRWCVSLTDATTGKTRLFAFNGPCT